MRDCGDCTVCCTLCHVPELGKVEGAVCEHCDQGCRIYDGRPKSCASYKCEWLKGGLQEFMRPDISGAMIEVYPEMVGLLLAPGMTLNKLGSDVMQILSEYVDAGKPVIATGQAALLPKDMGGQEAKDILVRTVGEYRDGC